MAVGLANATLITIGTASYDDGSGAADYKLIWDDDNNGNSVVWLDYTNNDTDWTSQTAWAAGLDADLTVSLYAGYSVSWDDIAWRLPATVDGTYTWGYDGTTTAGYNITTSEMGHLYYEELGNLGYYATDGTIPQPGWGLNNTEDFDNLIASWYWSGTEYADDPDGAWGFRMGYGYQTINYESYDFYGLAVRSGQVSTAPIPEPATMLLFGIGLVSLAGVGRRRKGSCV